MIGIFESVKIQRLFIAKIMEEQALRYLCLVGNLIGFALDEALLAENFRRCFEDSGDLFQDLSQHFS
jgi:hypothetical protein